MAAREDLPALVIGAGPAGLAASAELTRHGVTHRVLEAGSRVAYTWTRLYDSLRLHTGKHMSTLPRLRFGGDVPLFPSRGDFVAYLERYARTFDVPADVNRPATRVRRERDLWVVSTPAGQIAARALVIAY